VRTCETCFATFKPAPQCPVCGAECAASQREIQQLEGELKELVRNRPYDCIYGGMYIATGEETVEERIEIERHNLQVWAETRAKNQRREVGRARTLQELLAVAKQRGYSPGWAYRLHAARSHG
jgi:hypothetical protein